MQQRAEPGLLLEKGVAALGLPVDRDGRDRLTRYALELLKWNRSINLVARRATPAEVIDRHFLDSLTLLTCLDTIPDNQALADIGTGAGFPGLVLAAARPDHRIILVEPRSKRVSFLRHVIRLLALDNVEIAAHRLEECGELARQEIALVTSRALAEPATFLAMIAPLMERGTRALLMLAATTPLPSLPGNLRIAGQHPYTLPFSGIHRRLVEVEQIG